MQFHPAESQPYTYIVEDDNGKQLGTIDEFHNNANNANNNANDNNANETTQTISYIAIRFGRGMFEQKEFSGFTAAARFVGENR